MQIPRTLTPAESEAHELIRGHWDRLKSSLDLTQSEVGIYLGIEQSAVSNYLNGSIAFNVPRVLDFARILRVSPLVLAPTMMAPYAKAMALSVADQDDHWHRYQQADDTQQALMDAMLMLDAAAAQRVWDAVSAARSSGETLAKVVGDALAPVYLPEADRAAYALFDDLSTEQKIQIQKIMLVMLGRPVPV